MKYKLLKPIESHSIEMWSIIDPKTPWVIDTDDFWIIPIPFLIANWFLEEVVEDKILPFKIGEKVVSNCDNAAFIIYLIEECPRGRTEGDYVVNKDYYMSNLRKPTAEELVKYFN